MGHWKEQWPLYLKQTAPDENWTKALDNVESAIRVAKQREQSLNLIFALNHLTAVMMSREVLRASVRDQKEYASYEEARVGTQVSWKSLLTDLEEISEDILSIDWTMIRSDDFRSFLQGPWVAICADVQMSSGAKTQSEVGVIYQDCNTRRSRPNIFESVQRPFDSTYPVRVWVDRQCWVNLSAEMAPS